MKFETLGDWCKWLEKSFSPEIMIPTLPVIIRLDGNNFHKGRIRYTPTKTPSTYKSRFSSRKIKDSSSSFSTIE